MLYHYEKMNIFYTKPGTQSVFHKVATHEFQPPIFGSTRDVTGNIAQSRWRMFRIWKGFYEVKTGFGEKRTTHMAYTLYELNGHVNKNCTIFWFTYPLK